MPAPEPFFDEAVLIAADEAIVFRLLIGLHLYTRLCGNGANVVAQRGFAQPLNFEVFQGGRAGGTYPC